MSGFLNKGITAIRDEVQASVVTHVGVSTDTTAFNASQTVLDPANVGAANNLIKAATKADDGDFASDFSISINGDTEFTDKTIFTIGVLEGALRTDALSRTVRSQGIGVQAGDSFDIFVNVLHEDTTE